MRKLVGFFGRGDSGLMSANVHGLAFYFRERNARLDPLKAQFPYQA
jgi:hypothetical protein